VKSESAAAPHRPARRLRTDVFLMFGNKGTLLLAQTAGLVLVARELGTAGRGALAVGVNLTLVLVQVGTFGLVSANPFYVAREPKLRAAIVANSLGFAGFFGSLLVAAAIGLKLVAPAAVAGLTWTMVLIAAATIPPMLAMVYLQSVLLGEGRTVAYNAVEAGLSAGVLLALVVGFAFLGMGVTGALFIYLAQAVLGACVFAALLLRRGAPVRPRLGLARRMIGYAFRVYVATLLTYLVIRLDVLLVNGYLGRSEAGIYTVATGIADALFVIPAVVGLNLFPRIARGGDAEVTASVFRSIALLYGVVCLVAALAAEPVIAVLFGHAFHEAAPLYWWLTPGVWSMGMLTILTQHFIGRGFPIQAVLVWSAGLAVNIALNVAFLSSHGTYIAPLSSTVAYTLVLALYIRLFAHEVGSYAPLVPRPREAVRFVRVALGRTPSRADAG
jgi:O-antigen/teichoic acid export membrane protein